MKYLCKHCLNPCKKFGKVDCNDYKTESAEYWKKEWKLLLDGSNPKRAEQLRKKIDFFNYGIQ